VKKRDQPGRKRGGVDASQRNDKIAAAGQCALNRAGFQAGPHRFDKRDDIHKAFMDIGCSMICWRRLHSSSGYF
jgi:hypothetical protein